MLGGLGALDAIATPMSARLSAGASLTPSPVMATTSPLRCSARTSRSLCSGPPRPDARGMAGRDGRDRLRPRRVGDPDDPDELQAVGQVLELEGRGPGFGGPPGRGEHP
jgi:hypothetical protein